MDFLNNTDIVVAIGFVIFVGILIYVGVPAMVTKKLDERAVRIRKELDEARALRDEAQSLLASYERRQKEVSVQAEEIVAAARVEAEKAAERQAGEGHELDGAGLDEAAAGEPGRSRADVIGAPHPIGVVVRKVDADLEGERHAGGEQGARD